MRRVITRTVATVCLGLLALSIVDLFWTHYETQRWAVHQSENYAHHIARSLAAGDYTRIAEDLHSYFHGWDLREATVWDRHGFIVTHYGTDAPTASQQSATESYVGMQSGTLTLQFTVQRAVTAPAVGNVGHIRVVIGWNTILAVPLIRLAMFLGVLLATVITATIASSRTIAMGIAPLLDIASRLRSTRSAADLGHFQPSGEFAETDTLLTSIGELSRRLTDAEQRLLAEATLASIGQVASQVAHDIRSPLTALKVVTRHIDALSEDKRILIRHAVQRIDDIANNLASHHQHAAAQPVNDPPHAALVSSLIEPIVSEKRIQYRHLPTIAIVAPLDAGAYGLFATVQPVEFKRILSNLINNAVEAMPNGGTVTIHLTQPHPNQIAIHIADTGHGIPAERVPLLMQRGATFDKPLGAGLGLFHAKTTITRWGGSIALTSLPTGTTVTLTLPRGEAPDWFVPALRIPAQSTIAILDDDMSIHQVWRERLAIVPGVQLQHYVSADALLASPGHPAPALLLCDYELLGSTMNGLELIAQRALQHCAILVTSHYDDPTVRHAAQAMGVRILPKGLAGYVRISS